MAGGATEIPTPEQIARTQGFPITPPAAGAVPALPGTNALRTAYIPPSLPQISAPPLQRPPVRAGDMALTALKNLALGALPTGMIPNAAASAPAVAGAVAAPQAPARAFPNVSGALPVGAAPRPVPSFFDNFVKQFIYSPPTPPTYTGGGVRG